MTSKEKAEKLVNQFRMVLMDEDTECGNELLCTSIAIKNALIMVIITYHTNKNPLRELFPNYKGNPGIEVYEDDNSAKIVTYLNVSENRIEVMWTEWDEGIGG